MDMIPMSKLSFKFHVWLDGMKMRDRKFWWLQVTKEGLWLGLSLYCIESYPLPCPHDQFPLELAILPYWEAESWGLTYLSIEMKRLFYVIWVDLNSITDVFDDGGRGRFDTGSRCHVTTEAGVQVVDSQPGAPTATQACINLRQSSHRASGVRFWLALLTPLFRVSEL